METTALNPRQSVMNRTIVITKKKSGRRQMILPEVAVPTPTNCAEISPKNGEQKLHFGTEISTDFAELGHILRANSVRDEMVEKVLALANFKAKQCNEWAEKFEKDKLLNRQLFELKLKAANKNSEKAIELFKILGENGIDIDAILDNRSANFKCRASPTGTNEGDESSSSSLKLANQNEIEMKLMRENRVLNGEINSLEENYSNLFKLYEKTRLNCSNMKEVEHSLSAQLEQMEKKYGALHKMYMELLVEAQKKLENANEALTNSERDHQQKSLSIRMALKRAQIRIGSLETALKLQNQENAELHTICDQLIEARENEQQQQQQIMPNNTQPQ